MLRSEVLAIRPFRNLLLGQAISQLGDAFYYVSFMFMVNKLTGSAAMVGFVGAVETLPFLLLAPYAGVLADRLDRRKLMLASDILSGFSLWLLAAVIFFNATPPLWLLFVTAAALSSFRVFFMPAKNASIPVIVPKDLVLRAVTFSMGVQNSMFLISLAFSAAIMGALYALSTQWFFLTIVLVNSLSFFGSAYFIALLPKIVPERDQEVKSHALTDLKEGLSYILRRNVLVALLLLGLFLNLVISPFFVVYVAANKEWFGDKPQTLAWFEFAFFLGMIGGTWLVGRLNPKRPGVSYVFGCLICGIGVALMAVSRSFSLFFAWNILAGLALPFAQIPVNAYLQVTVSDAFRGRVNSAMTMLSAGVMPLGMGLGGKVVEWIGLVAAFAAMGLGMVAVALAGLAYGPFRNSSMDDGDEAKAPLGVEVAEPLEAAAS